MPDTGCRVPDAGFRIPDDGKIEREMGRWGEGDYRCRVWITDTGYQESDAWFQIPDAGLEKGGDWETGDSKTEK
jgi:hypothetical protein